MANYLSSIMGSDAPFASNRDEEFAERLKSPRFWRAVLESQGLLAMSKDPWGLCRQIAMEGFIVFILRYRQNLTPEQIVQNDQGGKWTLEDVERLLRIVHGAREAWDRGEIKLDSYPPSIQALLDKAQRGESLTENERFLVCTNLFHRQTEKLYIHPVQAEIAEKELAGLSGEERKKRVQRILAETLRRLWE